MTHTFNATIKDPYAELFDDLDWRPWLEGEEIIHFEVISTSPDFVVLSPRQADGVVEWEYSGGVVGQSYLVRVFIRTPRRADVRSVRYEMRQR